MNNKPSRVPVCIRLAVSGLTWVDHLAHEHRVSRAAVIRASLAVARQHPKAVIEIIEANA
jgi:hypothetical protein